MAQVTTGASSGEGLRIFPSKTDVIKAFIIIIIAFVFGGFQAAIFGMLTVPVSGHFGISASMIVFFDSFGMWGQILAMAFGGLVISKIKGKNTLLLAGIIMVIASVCAIISPNIYIYTSMTFLANIATGFILVSCYYMVMGTVGKGDCSETRLSIAGAFFSIGYMLSPLAIGFIVANLGWKYVFITITALFVIFIIVLLLINVQELVDKHTAAKQKAKIEDKAANKKFITGPLIITAIVFFMLLYTEQIIYYFSQPYLMLNLKFAIEISGTALFSFGLAQLIGRFVIGKYILPKVKAFKYIIITVVIYAILMIIFLNLTTIVTVMIIMACLGLVDSCLYPTILGYGLDQIGNASPRATSFMITIGSLGIPLGTMGCGLIGENVSRPAAIMVAPVILIIMGILIYIVHVMNKNKKSVGA
ncbi:MAG: MFS transporter [bacterium]|nr:MFS transporter [bacterium]